MKVSVSVVTYNHKNYIKQCLDSILMQETDFDYEIILGEDESTDGTREICLDYANRHPEKIRLFLRSRKDVILINEKPSGRYNFIENLKTCNGQYIALCEGDDYWTDPLKLQRQVDFLENNKTVNICFHKAKVLKNGELIEHRILPKFIESPFDYIELIKNYNFIITASVLFRNIIAYELPEWYKTIPYGDMALYKLLTDNKKIFCLHNSMAIYRIHDKGIYSGISRPRAKLLYLKFYKNICPYLNKEEKKEAKIITLKLIKELAKHKFPNQIVFKYFYSFYLKFSYWK